MDDNIKNNRLDDEVDSGLEAIAIIGWSGRFPGADDIESFWENIREGRESIEFYSDEELRQAGMPDALLKDPDFVKAGAKIRDAEMFDAEFFAYTPRESVLMDPQHRVFLESAWHALENAGIDSRRCAATIGVFAGTNPDSYMQAHFNEKEFAQAPAFDKRVSSDSSFFTSRIAYKLNLKGPAITVETACSTSLVAICVACQHLMTYQCDLALAGGATVHPLRKSGYMFQAHGIHSPDGHCRSFDESARGTIGGEGVATVVLKRLEDALTDGDSIHAVIKGWALNNDGNQKVGFTAPSVEGQAEVIEMAQALAGISAESVGYLEAHGTGTELGDPVEVAALNQAFAATTDKTGFCSLGSVKANIGHLDAAAGVAGLIKAALVLKNRQIPPLLHYRKPNPKINFETSPFYVDTELKPWLQADKPRRAGVSSFGIGGTNAHVVLEESPAEPTSGETRARQLILLSAKNQAQCDQALANLADWLESHPQQALADVAYTLQTGRAQFASSAVCVAADRAEAIASLRQAESPSVFKGQRSADPADIAFMFPGQGNQYLYMGHDLYRSESAFREIVDRSCEMIEAEFAFDLRQIIYPPGQQDDESAARTLTRTEYAQPALFVIEYAMASLLMSWGVQPQALIGHSIGEYVAATLAGVFRLEDALRLVVQRGRLMQSAPAGSMAAIPLSADKLRQRLPPELSIAAINEPGMCVVSGDSKCVEDFLEVCAREDLHCHPLQTSHAFHSEMMAGILADFSELIKPVLLASPGIPFISNVSGDWITDQQATDPNYWVDHIRHTVLFEDGLRVLLKQPARLLYEIGPGNSLSSILRRHPERDPAQAVVTSMRHPRDQRDDLALLLESLGLAWQGGADIDWAAFYRNEQRIKVPLPGYPFAKKPHWIKRSTGQAHRQQAGVTTYPKLPDISDWFYLPSWLRQPAAADFQSSDHAVRAVAGQDESAKSNWLIFIDQSRLSKRVLDCLDQQDHSVVTVKYGESFARESAQSYSLSNAEADYQSLVEALIEDSLPIDKVVYLWTAEIDGGAFSSGLDTGFYIPLFLVQALNRYFEKSAQSLPLDLFFVTRGAQQVVGSEDVYPAMALVSGVARVSSQEMPHIRARCIDLEPCHQSDSRRLDDQSADYLLAELSLPENSGDNIPEVAYRGRYRWLKTMQAMPFKPQDPGSEEASYPGGRLKQNGVYLITGGLGGIGRALSAYLAENFQARLVLTGRSELPDKASWDDWIAGHEADDGLSRKINFIRDLESKGGEVLNIVCDVADFDEMKTALETATGRFGRIDGVIHSAGVAGGGLIQLKDRQSAADILAPKVQGALVLDALFEDQPLDFMLFCSSLAAILGGVGQVDYTAANIFLDALASQRQNRGLYTVSINWDIWGEAGMAAEAEIPVEYQAHLREALKAGIGSQEGVEVFTRVLRQNCAQVTVSTRAIFPSIPGMRQAEQMVAGKFEQTVADSPMELPQTDASEDAVLPENYKAPTNDIEAAICAIWQEMFGIPRIGIEDDFFELGGHSLLAVQILSRIYEATKVKISLNDFFDAKTVARLAEIVGQQGSALGEAGAGETPDDIVDALSDEEVARLLAEKVYR